MKQVFILLVFIYCNSVNAQTIRQPNLLVIGNYDRICLNDSTITTSDTLPASLKHYDAILLFSTSTSQLKESDIDRLTTFVELGGGLYSGADNWPLQAESNQLTNHLYQKESFGQYEQVNAEYSHEGELKLEEMKNIPAGRTTVAFPLDYRLKVEAWVADQPLISSGKLGQGRIVIDGGYSRFYCDQRSADSDQLMQKIVDFLCAK